MSAPLPTTGPATSGRIGATPTAAPSPPANRYRRYGRWIDEWRPEDPQFWDRTGRRIARRNLAMSVFSEHIGFSVWSLWSVLVLFLPQSVYGIDPAGKFLLTAVPTLVGAAIRLPYTFAVATFGGRNFTVISALLLLVPSVFVAIVLVPGVSYTTLLIAAATAGVGGGNFASSMTNINAFYPQRLKGWALGINAGGGNIGVAVVQLVGLLVLATAGVGHPRLIVAVYLPLIVLAALGAALVMDNLTVSGNAKGAIRAVARQGHTWVISLLYIGTFGSFIGFGFAFGQVLQVQFAATFATPVTAACLTFLGPLLGSLSRPIGGRMADRWGGARVSFWNFAGMAGGAALVLVAARTSSLPMYVAAFVVLFVLAGLGNGSVYKMIPAIFQAKAAVAVAGGAEFAAEALRSQRLTGALIGLAGAVGAFGGVLVNLAFRQSFLAYRTATAAYVAFLVCYLLCCGLTWYVYLRRSPDRLAGV